MTKQQFIRKGIYLGHDKSTIIEVANQIEKAGRSYDEFLPNVEIGMPSLMDSSYDRFCPIRSGSVTSIDCHQTIATLSTCKINCSTCDHSEWF